MKIHLISDIHTEWEHYFIPDLEDEANTVVVLAGDIGVAKRPETTYLGLVRDACARFRHVIMIMGNHEHWTGNFPTTYDKILADTAELDNFDIMEKETLVIDEVAFVCATLWTDMDKNDHLLMYNAKEEMVDYRKIRTGPDSMPWKQKLRPLDTMTDHRMAKEYIFPQIELHKKLGNKVVVVTHHLPSYMSVHKSLTNHSMNGAYASELGNEIADLEPDIWCHGHTHNSFDYMLANTRIVCNPRGYAPAYLNEDFINDLIIEI